MKTAKKLFVLSLFLMIAACLPAISSQAATPKTAAPAYNGKWTYYAVENTIYKLDSQTGSAKKVKTISSTCYISDISYKSGYLYFTANDYMGSDASENFICRMKTNGSGYKKLTRGYHPSVYNGRIYYIALKHTKDKNGYESDQSLGIYSMKLNGDKKTVIKKGSQYPSFLISKGNLYYKLSYSSKSIYCYNIAKKTTAKVSAITFDLEQTDGNYLAGKNYDNSSQNDILRVYNTSNGSVQTVAASRILFVLAIKDNKVYYVNGAGYPTYKYCCYNIKTKKTTVLSSTKRSYRDITLSKSGYCPVTVTLSTEEMKKSNYRYDIAAGRFKLNGTKLKLLRKYFVS